MSDETPEDDGAVGGQQAGEQDDDASRRWLIRILVGLGLGIPIAIEGVTFLGLVGSRFGDGGESTPTPTPAGRKVGVGDELLPETPPVDTMTRAEVTAGTDAWTFHVAVEVDNTGDVPYQLTLGEVTTTGGRVVDGAATTGQIAPGETATVENAWAMPSGARPSQVVVEALTFPEDGDPQRTRTTVRLANVPVRG